MGDSNGYSDVFVHDRQTAQTRRVSVASGGAEGDRASGGNYPQSISADGRYIAFSSGGTNLVSGDTNASDDIFVFDSQTGETTRISVASNGTQGNARSLASSISGDGRYVTFQSEADNLVTGDTNGFQDIFVHDRQTGQTTRVSETSGGLQADSTSWNPVISSDGRFVSFRSSATNLVAGDTNGSIDIFVYDLQTGETTVVSVAPDGRSANGSSDFPRISDDGRYVAFTSVASNLVSDDTNGKWDVFIYDRR